MLERGLQRRALPPVPLVQDECHVLRQLATLEQLARPVLRPVVDEHELARLHRQLGRQRVVDRALDRRELVVDGHQDRERRRHRRHPIRGLGTHPLCVGTCAREPEGYDRAVRELEIDGRRIADDTPCFVIAEIGHNHQGSVEKAQELFVLAKQAGVDAVKLQKRDNRRAVHPRALRQRLRQREQLRPDVRRPPRGARARSRRLCRAAGVRPRARPRVLRDGVRRGERRPALRARRSCVQDRVRRPPQHAAPAPCRCDRQAADRLHRRRDDRGRRSRRRDRDGDQPAALPAAVHRVLPGLRRGARARRHRHVPRALPGARRRPVGPPGRHRDGARRVHARRTRDREALHGEPHGEGHRSCVLPHAGGDAEARPRSPPCPRRDRRRRQAAAPERGGAARGRWGSSSSRRVHSRRATCSPRATSSRSRRPRAACRRIGSTIWSGTHAPARAP